MSYNGSGTFVINSTGQPVVTGTVISSSTFNSLTADLGTGLSTAITKDGQTTTTAKIPFALGISAAVASNFAAGTVAAPSIYLSTDTGTGFYRIGANNNGYSVSGTKLLDLGSALVGVTGALTVSTTLGVTGATTLSSTLAVSGIISANNNNSGIQLSSSGGSGMHIYGGAGTHQWDIYLNSTNLRIGDNTGGGSVVIDTPLAIGGALTGVTTLAASGDLTLSGANGKVSAGTTTTGGYFANSTSTAFYVTYGATHATLANQLEQRGDTQTFKTVGGTTIAAMSSALFAVTGAATISTTLGVTGNISGSGTASWLSRSGATTAAVYQRTQNTSGDLIMGVESSTGGAILTGAAAYSSFVMSNAGTFNIGAGGTLAAVFTGANTALQGTLDVTGGIVGSSFLKASQSLATPAGGTSATGIILGTATVQIIWGSGAPTANVAKGSLYLRTDGSGTNDRMYINTNGTTTWTAVVTVA